MPTYIDSIESLKEYCLRSLGKPVINIEVTDDQCYDRIFDALTKFSDRHYAGSFETWRVLSVTAADISRGWIEIPDYWTSIAGVMAMSNQNTSTGEDFENFNFRLANSDILTAMFDQGGNGGGQPFLNMQMFHEKMDLINRYFAPSERFRFNHLAHRLDITGTIFEDQKILVHGWIKFDPDEFVDIYGEDFVRRYSTALIGRQWGTNISKYDGIQLPGGMTMNGQQIYDRYNTIVEHMDETFSMKYELPVDFWIA